MTTITTTAGALRVRAIVAADARNIEQARLHEEQEAQEAARKVEELRMNAERLVGLVLTITGVEVPIESVTPPGKEWGMALVTVDDIRFGLGMHRSGSGPMLYALATCTRDGCAHRDWPVAAPIRSLADLGDFLDDEGFAAHAPSSGDCTKEDWE